MREKAERTESSAKKSQSAIGSNEITPVRRTRMRWFLVGRAEGWSLIGPSISETNYEREGQTLGTEGDRDGVGKDVDTLEHGGSTLVGELDLLVGGVGPSEAGLGRGGDSVEGGETVHGVGGGDR